MGRRPHLPFRELQLEGIPVEAQKPGGLAPVPSNPLKDAENDLPLELLAGLSQRQCLGLTGSAAWVRKHEVDGEILESDHRALDQHHRALDDVLELAYVLRLPPTRSISRSWSTRRSFAWSSGLSAPTSSRKRLPPWASSNFPRRRW